MRSVRARRLLKRIGTAVAILVIAGLVYEQVGRRQDRERYPQVGQSVDIGGRSLNISCIGEGGPTVVFDTFGHMAGFGWTGAQAKVSEFARACWYDRAGYGWSDPASRPRTFEVVARDLHDLLQASELAPPYVFVGGGDAALHLRVYHGLYPSEVAGLLFIDANDVVDDAPEMQAGQGPWRRVFGPFAPQFRAAGCAVRPLLHRIGLMRLVWQLTGSRSTDPDGPTSEQGAQQDFLSDNPTAQ